MRNVIVTGGTRGLGLGIVQRLAKAGFHPIAIARSEGDQFAAAQRRSVLAGYGALDFVPFDLTQIDDISKLITILKTRFGGVYGLVNNAGMSTDGPLALTPTAKIEQIVRLNTLSPMVLTKYVVRSMMSDGGGRIVNISSITASTGYSGLSVYAATKAYVNSFSEALRIELRGSGVNVLALCPGPVETEFGQVASRENSKRKFAPPDFLCVSKAEVVSDTLRRLRRGGRLIPGILVRIPMLLAESTPRWILRFVFNRASGDYR